MLKRKSDVFSVFKQFRALVEKNTGRTIKCLRTNNGGEFTSKEFDRDCKDAGIERHKTRIYTPQQNGVVERMNRTLLERARSMLSNVGLQKELWTEAVATTCYVINRSPSTAIGCKIPQEVWKGHPCDYSKLRVFGCDAYALVPKHQRTKLDPKSKSHDDHSSHTSHEQVSESAHEHGSGLDHEQVSDIDHQEVPTDGSQPIEEAPETSLRRSTRIKRPPRRYDDHVTSVAFTANNDETLCYEEAIEGSKSDKWKAAMKDEMMALEDRYKVRLVAKGFSQKAGIDFHDIFSPVVKIVN
eukprot:PITA_27973